MTAFTILLDLLLFAGVHGALSRCWDTLRGNEGGIAWRLGVMGFRRFASLDWLRV